VNRMSRPAQLLDHLLVALDDNDLFPRRSSRSASSRPTRPPPTMSARIGITSSAWAI
jgi:hypothetical protein